MDQRRSSTADPTEAIVITGIGMIASVGNDRESVWRAVREGVSGIRRLTPADHMPDCLTIAAPIDIEPEQPGQLKVISLALRAAGEALDDAGVYQSGIDFDRFGCAMSGHMGDISGAPPESGPLGGFQAVRSRAAQRHCSIVANKFILYTTVLPFSRMPARSTSSAIRTIRDGQCEIAWQAARGHPSLLPPDQQDKGCYTRTRPRRHAPSTDRETCS